MMCLLCTGTTSNTGLCPACIALLPRPHIACPVCAAETVQPLACGLCLQQPPHYHHTVAALQYHYPVQQLIHQLKYQRNVLPLPALVQELALQVQQQPLPDFLLPVPLHPVRLLQRGYNQAQLIAELLGKYLHIPVLDHVLRRKRHTPGQTKLGVQQRRRNLRNVFVPTAVIPAGHIAIVDDVLTTGSTCNEIAGVLHRQGCEQISVWVLARARLTG